MKNIHVLVLVVVLLAVGCSENVKITGKVTFSDGKPLTVGRVFFVNEKLQACGDLTQDGTYILGSLKLTDGLPRGNYKVYVSGAVYEEEDPKMKQLRESGKFANLPKPLPTFIQAINMKYESPETSGLVCDVKKPMKYDFTVEPPPPKAKR